MKPSNVHQLHQVRGMGETDAPLHPEEEAGVLFDNYRRVKATEVSKKELAKAVAGGDEKQVAYWKEVLRSRENDEEGYQANVADGWCDDDQ